MNTKHYIIVAGLIVVSSFGIGYIHGAFAGESEVARIEERISQLQREIQENQEQYRGIALSIGANRAHCDLAAAKEAQLTKLNGSNSAKRTEIEILSSLLIKDDAEIHLGK